MAKKMIQLGRLGDHRARHELFIYHTTLDPSGQAPPTTIEAGLHAIEAQDDADSAG